MITACTVVATTMQGLDSTITNVALPYIEAGLSTTADQVTWVLTSYVIAAAVMTAPVGWLAARFGRRRLFIACLAGFTLASMLCGAAQSMPQMVIVRLLQGAFGAALVPLSQATMLDIYPIERRAQAMAIWGIGVMVGPIMGPTLGGWLTALCGWRFVFYVNLPFGLLAIAGLAMFMPSGKADSERGFDWTGFLALALGIGALQFMLDRGQAQDWFTSPEIVIEAVLAGLGFYLFVVHMLTAGRPFLPRGLFLDRNIVAVLVMTFLTGLVHLASTALLATYLQKLAGYPVQEAGLAMAPRGIGTMAGMLLAGWLGSRIDQRLLMASGVLLLAWSLFDMSLWTPDVPLDRLTVTIVIQGFATGITSNPLSVLAYATLAPRWRGDAAALISLFRNTAAAIGISVTACLLTQVTQVSHAALAQRVTPFNRMLQGIDPTRQAGAALLDTAISRQAAIIAYSNDFHLLMGAALLPLLVIPLMRRGPNPHRTKP
jgi:DHA2 family multidrug resistance protein